MDKICPGEEIPEEPTKEESPKRNYIHTLENDRRNMEKEIERLERQIGKLASYIMQNDLMPIGFHGGAVDCAILIIENFRGNKNHG